MITLTATADQDRPGNDGKDLGVRGKNARKQTDPASALKITNKKKRRAAALTT
jgi:hypothetical protein